jgi:predicted flap endonuclease-1-like 5' DNA nuclease
MFTNDVTKNYELQDATFEILIMLAGAFLLGVLFCWAMGKLRGNKQNRKHPYQRKTVDHQNGFRQPTQQVGYSSSNLLEESGATGIIGGSVSATGSDISDASSSIISSAATPPLSGSKLATAGSATTERLADITSPITTSKATISVTDTLPSLEEETSTTTAASTASLAEEKEAIKEKTLDVAERANNTLSDTKITLEEKQENSETTDNFKKIEGIGSKIESVLHAAGIKTYADLRASDNHTLKAILNTANPVLALHDPETWPYQADLAYNEKWEKLKEYQDFLMGREA